MYNWIGVPLINGVPPFRRVDLSAVVVVDKRKKLDDSSFEFRYGGIRRLGGGRGCGGRLVPVAKFLRQIDDKGRPLLRLNLITRHPYEHFLPVRESRHSGHDVGEGKHVNSVVQSKCIFGEVHECILPGLEIGDSVRCLDCGVGVPLINSVTPFQLIDFSTVVVVNQGEELHHGSFELLDRGVGWRGCGWCCIWLL